jgi:hypothetical protein
MKILMDSSTTTTKKIMSAFLSGISWESFDKIYKILGFNYGIDDEQFYQQTSCRLKMSIKI